MIMKINNKGFSLIELIIYIALSVIILFGATDFILAINSAKQRGFIVGEVENQGSHMMDYITRSIRGSSSINHPSAGSSSQSLSLSNANSLLNPTIFSNNGQILTVAEGSNSALSLHNNLVIVENLTFSNLSLPGTNGSVKIKFDVRYNSNSGDPRMSYKKTFFGSASVR